VFLLYGWLCAHARGACCARPRVTMHAGGADTETVSKHKFIGSLLEHCQDRQVPVICAHELVPPGMHPLLS